MSKVQIKGAVASGERVIANIGGDLNIESLQDTSTYDSEQTTHTAGASIPVIGVPGVTSQTI